MDISDLRSEEFPYPGSEMENRCDGGGLRGDPVSVALIIHDGVWFRF
ncbi:MAG: hypothetical protein SBU_001260 [Candidatus Syntrophoarchaeum butanivorans]|uniref:Uncharacterized protein n=1 Tax=Candidatus Syntropharchaeum butanivorans TaxID=1839936 RepID=A0A1F2P4Z5_9EURY|nr:MAG: hypothetical protein SBU_001260 [Candidatus Syntrophoarchaeum butanivorans]